MFDGIERVEVKGQQLRMFVLPDPGGVFGTARVVLGGIGLHLRVDTQCLVGLVQQARRGNRAQQLAVVIGTRAPQLRQVVINRCADAHRPHQAGRLAALVVHGLPQGGDMDVLCVPVPAVIVFPLGVEGVVRVNAVHRWRHAGDQGGMARIRDGWRYTGNTGGIAALVQEGAQCRQVQSTLFGLQHIIGAQAVDRHHQHGSVGDGGGADGNTDNGEQGQKTAIAA